MTAIDASGGMFRGCAVPVSLGTVGLLVAAFSAPGCVPATRHRAALAQARALAHRAGRLQQTIARSRQTVHALKRELVTAAGRCKALAVRARADRQTAEKALFGAKLRARTLRRSLGRLQRELGFLRSARPPRTAQERRRYSCRADRDCVIGCWRKSCCARFCFCATAYNRRFHEQHLREVPAWKRRRRCPRVRCPRYSRCRRPRPIYRARCLMGMCRAFLVRGSGW